MRVNADWNRCKGSALKGWCVSVLLLALMGCTPGAVKQAGQQSISDEQQLYRQGRDLMEAEDYPQAVVRLMSLLRQYPQTPLRNDALLSLAYSQLQLGQAEEAIELAGQVIASSDDRQELAYGYYLRANARLAARPAPSAEQVESASVDLLQVTDRLGENAYRSAALALNEKLYRLRAAHELRAARIAHQRQEPVAVLNRCRYLIEHFPDSDEVGEALELMVSSYRLLGLDDLATATDAILQQRKAL